jgi:hypothetical protein
MLNSSANLPIWLVCGRFSFNVSEARLASAASLDFDTADDIQKILDAILKLIVVTLTAGCKYDRASAMERASYLLEA